MSRNDDFFIGYMNKVPRALRRFSLATGALLVVVFGALGFAIGATQDDPGDGAFRFDFGRQTVTGVMLESPYPSVYITEGNERLRPGHLLMLSGAGKNGVQARAAGLDGALVTASGVLLKRGTLDMLQIRGGAAGLTRAAPAAEPVPFVARLSHGRWQVAGEICDGKCLAGAMRPGRGVAHNACAQLCLAGGIPPVLATYRDVFGTRFVMLGGADGGPLPESILRHTAKPVLLTGRLEQRGDVFVMLVEDQGLEPL